MRVTDIQVSRDSEACELRAQVASDRDPDDVDWFEPFALWYRFPEWCWPYLSVDRGDPILAALLVPAMRLGEPLRLSAPISPKLRDSLQQIQEIYLAFDRRAHRIPVGAETRQASPAMPGEEGRAGLFFSMGVDSFYSLLKN